MTKKLTVAALAERVARATGESPAFHARQIRHWAQHGIFWDAFLPKDAGPTTSREFDEKHIARALVLSLLASQGLNVDELTLAAAFMSHLSADDAERLYPIGTPRPVDLGLATVLAETKRGEGVWFFELYRGKNGEVGGGEFTTNPQALPILASLYPFFSALNVSAFLPLIFEIEE